VYLWTNKSDKFLLFYARLPICLLFLRLIKTAYCVFSSVESTKDERKKQLAASPKRSALPTLHFRFISFQLQDFKKIKDAIWRATVNGAVFYTVTACTRKTALFPSRSFRSKSLYKIMVLSIVLHNSNEFCFLPTQGRTTKFYDEYRHHLHMYIPIYIYNAYVHTYINTQAYIRTYTRTYKHT
jgi:hypothetical protein